jgi:hypothetical protein
MKSKTKEITETKIGDNGEIQDEPVDILESIKKRIESLVEQHNEAGQKAEQLRQQMVQQLDHQKKCLGGIEIAEGLKKELELKSDGKN